jgi:hypothetical protein
LKGELQFLSQRRLFPTRGEAGACARGAAATPLYGNASEVSGRRSQTFGRLLSWEWILNVLSGLMLRQSTSARSSMVVNPAKKTALKRGGFFESL